MHDRISQFDGRPGRPCRIGRAPGRARRPLFAAVVVLPIVFAESAFALDPLGAAVDVTPLAVGNLGGVETTIVAGSQLFPGQLLTTGPRGEIQIIFTDQTRMVLGPNSALVIESYLLRGQNGIESFAANALGGTFRFITGNGQSEAYRITTPTGTIGIRGTAFDFSVDLETGQTNLLLYRGSVILCSLDGICFTLEDRCALGMLGPDGTGIPALERQRIRLVRATLPYAVTQGGLLAPFLVEQPQICLGEVLADPDIVPILRTSGGPPPPEPPPPPPPPPPPESVAGHNNNGFGNGGESPGEVGGEANNPGRGNGNAGGNNGNGNGNGNGN